MHRFDTAAVNRGTTIGKGEGVLPGCVAGIADGAGNFMNSSNLLDVHAKE